MKEITEELIRIELNVLKLEIEVAKSLNDGNKDEVFTKMLNLRMKSPLYTAGQNGHDEHYIGWLKWNVYDNELPYPSSGSFLVAIEDYDNAVHMMGNENEVSDLEWGLFDKLWDEIIK